MNVIKKENNIYSRLWYRSKLSSLCYLSDSVSSLPLLTPNIPQTALFFCVSGVHSGWPQIATNPHDRTWIIYQPLTIAYNLLKRKTIRKHSRDQLIQCFDTGISSLKYWQPENYSYNWIHFRFCILFLLLVFLCFSYCSLLQFRIFSESMNPFRRLVGPLDGRSARSKASGYTGQRNMEHVTVYQCLWRDSNIWFSDFT
jgi:hypothetical protein